MIAVRGRLAPALVVSTLVLIAAACGKKSSAPPPEVSGLAAVPASAQVVIAADVARVVDAPLVTRAIEQLLGRDADLATRWQKLHETCKLDVKQIKHVVIAIGPSAPDKRPGTGPVDVVATGNLVEADLAACVRAMVGQGGGALTAKDAAGRTLYQAKDGNRTMFFAFGRPDTVVLGSDEAFVLEAIGSGKKAADNPELSKWIALADQRAPLWAAGRVDERVSTRLVQVAGGKLSAGPQAMVLAVDPTNGAKIELAAVMATPDDAKTLESFAQTQLGGIALAAQVKGLGKIIEHIAIRGDGNAVRLTLTLDVSEVNQLISVLDGGGADKQDSPPPAGSGSAAP